MWSFWLELLIVSPAMQLPLCCLCSVVHVGADSQLRASGLHTATSFTGRTISATPSFLRLIRFIEKWLLVCVYDCLPPCMHVYHPYTWCLQKYLLLEEGAFFHRPEEGIRSFGTGINGSCSNHTHGWFLFWYFSGEYCWRWDDLQHQVRCRQIPLKNQNSYLQEEVIQVWIKRSQRWVQM